MPETLMNLPQAVAWLNAHGEAISEGSLKHYWMGRYQNPPLQLQIVARWTNRDVKAVTEANLQDWLTQLRAARADRSRHGVKARASK